MHPERLPHPTLGYNQIPSQPNIVLHYYRCAVDGVLGTEIVVALIQGHLAVSWLDRFTRDR